MITQSDIHGEEALILNALKKKGITKVNSYGDKNLLSELQQTSSKLLLKAWDFDNQTIYPGASDNKNSRSDIAAVENKDFLLVLTPKIFESNSIFIKYALQSSFIKIANHYLGMNAGLRAVQLWLNYANEGAPSATQLWHRDGDDFLNLKIFTYLSDVKLANGPFMYIPGTQHLGPRRIQPEASEYGRTNDEQMGEVVNASDWEVCLGNNGDVIFTDTTGFHKGLKPTENYRLMLMIHYASPKALSGKDIAVVGFEGAKFTSEQRKALYSAN